MFKQFKKLTTQKLNKMFNVHGYKITKLGGEISLRSIRKANDNSDDIKELREQIMDLDNSLKDCDDKIKDIDDKFKDYDDSLKDTDDKLKDMDDKIKQIKQCNDKISRLEHNIENILAFLDQISSPQ